MAKHECKRLIVISNIDPQTLAAPENQSAAIIGKVHASNQIENILAEITRLRRLRTKWNRRLGVCLKAIAENGYA
jgi:hypothetical protein